MLAGLLLVGVRASRAMVAEGATPGQVTLELWPAGQGRIDVAQGGVNVSSCDFTVILDMGSGCEVQVAAGVPVTLTAVPEPAATLTDDEMLKAPDYPVADPAFVRWSVFGCDGTGPCTYTPEDGDWVEAIFTPLELEVGVVGNGLVVDAADADALSCDDTVFFLHAITTCHGLYAADSSVVLEATPAMDDPGPTTWSPGCTPEGGNPTSPRCTVTMTNIRTFAVVGFPGDGNPFPFPFNITPQVRVALGGSGSGRVTGTGFDCGSDCTKKLAYQSPVTLNATASAGSHFVSWQGVCSTNPVCTFDAGSATGVKAIFDATATTTPPPPPTVTTTAAFRPRLQKAVMQHIGGHRVVVATLVVDRAAFATLRLSRSGRTIATTHWNLRAARTLARLRVPRTLKPGSAKLQVRIAAANAVRIITTSVRIGR
jgi:hypothetical protein